jgi:hypothetical protein
MEITATMVVRDITISVIQVDDGLANGRRIAQGKSACGGWGGSVVASWE